MIADIAQDVASDRIAKGKPVAWPPGKSLENATEQKDFPADVWQEATTRWQELDRKEQERQINQRKKELAAAVARLNPKLHRVGFLASFGPFDILWFLLATFSAYKIGSGLALSRD